MWYADLIQEDVMFTEGIYIGRMAFGIPFRETQDCNTVQYSWSLALVGVRF